MTGDNEFWADDAPIDDGVDNSCYMGDDADTDPDDVSCTDGADVSEFDDEPDVDDWNGFIFGRDDEYDRFSIDDYSEGQSCGFYDE